ncbi:MAG: methyltransferase domain-containing protein [Sphingomonadaceae bacterium]
MALEVIDRLDSVKRDFRTVLILGSDFGLLQPELAHRGLAVTVADPGCRVASASGGIQCDEDFLPFERATFDIIIALGTLDTVDDLPGALIQIRRLLTPDGLLLGAMMGAGSLSLIKAILAEELPGSAHAHPQIDVRATGDLLARAGFALPVADCETVTVRYSRFSRLVSDLRANGQSNVLTSRRNFSRASFARTAERFDMSDRRECFALLYMTGWAPSVK